MTIATALNDSHSFVARDRKTYNVPKHQPLTGLDSRWFRLSLGFPFSLLVILGFVSLAETIIHGTEDMSLSSINSIKLLLQVVLPVLSAFFVASSLLRKGKQDIRFFRIVKANQQLVIERLGRDIGAQTSPGPNFLLPGLESGTLVDTPIMELVARVDNPFHAASGKIYFVKVVVSCSYIIYDSISWERGFESGENSLKVGFERELRKIIKKKLALSEEVLISDPYQFSQDLEAEMIDALEHRLASVGSRFNIYRGHERDVEVRPAILTMAEAAIAAGLGPLPD